MGHVRDRMDADLRLAGHSESTRKRYLDCAARLVKHFMRSPEERGEQEARDYLLYLAEERKLAAGTRLQYHAALRFLFAVTLNRPGVVRGIPWPRQRRHAPIVPTRDEVRRLFRAADRAPYWRTLFRTAYAGGLRRMEVVALRAQDVDSREGLLRVEHAKGGKRRVVQLDADLLPEVRGHCRRHALPGPWLFPAPKRAGWRDRPITLNAASTAFRRFADEAGLDRRYRLHNLRHAFATHLLEDDVDLATLQVLLGHERLDTTSRYTGVRTDRIRRLPSLLRKLRM